MNQYCFIQCLGKCKVPDEDKWHNNVSGGLNRLIYINGGEGGYYHKGIKHKFKTGLLYLLPCYDDIPTWSSYESDEKRLDHTYVNFELVPPIITKEVVEFDPHSDPLVKAAFEVLSKISESSVDRKVYSLKNEELQYLKATIIYILDKMIAAGCLKTLDDKMIISALEKMHKGIASNISIREIAESSFVSYEGFIRKFNKILGMTPYTYLKQLRIRTAAALRAEGATLEEAAERCGYSDATSLLHAISNEKKLLKTKI